LIKKPERSYVLTSQLEMLLSFTICSQGGQHISFHLPTCSLQLCIH